MMQQNLPRLLLAGVSSGSGKTTLTCALLRAWQRRGRRLLSMKCGPDYIDPMFHRRVLGVPAGNLDLFFSGEQQVRQLLGDAACRRKAELVMLEGAMGYYDGLGNTTRASAWQMACATETPAVLVVNCRGMGISVLAVIRGFLDYCPQNRLRGVIFNQLSAARYPQLRRQLWEELGLEAAGYFPPRPDLALGSRHLGLVTAGEIQDLEQRLDALADQAEASLELDRLAKWAAEAPALCWEPLPPEPSCAPVTIAVAQDEAFCFYYDENLAMLERMGAQLRSFSPRRDSALPSGTQGLYLGGGYPELYARELEENASLRREIRDSIQAGMPCIAECGGFQYLQQQLVGEDGSTYTMCGALPGKSWPTGKLCRFGYVDVTLKKDCLLGPAGTRFPAHEFHYWDSEFPGADATAQKPGRPQQWDCLHASETLAAGYSHLYFPACPEAARRFLQRAAGSPPAGKER